MRLDLRDWQRQSISESITNLISPLCKMNGQIRSLVDFHSYLMLFRQIFSRNLNFSNLLQELLDKFQFNCHAGESLNIRFSEQTLPCE